MAAAAVGGLVAAGGGVPAKAQEIASIPFESIPEGTTVEGGGSPITLDGEVVVSGTVRHQGVLKQGFEDPVTYEISTRRHVVEASPAEVGQLIQLDHDLMISLCRDVDGCEVALAMIFHSGGFDAVWSRTARLFLSESGWWRLSDVDAEGRDDNDSVSVWTAFDCHLTDAESGADYISRTDSLPGFALSNPVGGTYSDANISCRVVLID